MARRRAPRTTLDRYPNADMIDHVPMKRSPGSRRDRESLVRTACQECSVACGLVASVAHGRVVDVHGDEDHPVSRGRLCARGSAFVQGLTLPERLTAPAARRKPGGPLEPLDDWKAAVDLLAERLRAVRERHGPDALVIGCDREGGLDFHVGALRFARLWGTAQVFHADGERVDPSPDGLDAPAAPCPDWVNARCLLLVEADLAATHPVALGWVQEAQRRGAQVIAVDARFTPTMAHADVAMRLRPGQGNLLGLALAKLLAARRPPADPALAGAFPGAAAWRASLEAMSLERAEVVLGAAPEHLARLASHLESGPVTVITGRALAGLPHHRVWLALAHAMGWAGRPGGGWYPLDAGAPALPADADLPDAGAQPAAARPTLSELTARGGIRAVVCSGDALAAHLAPFGGLAAQSEVVAHFGSFPNATRDAASLSFPAALWAERDGLVFAADRTVEWGRALVQAPAGCRTGLDFWIELARRFGWEKHFPWTGEDGRADAAAFSAWLLARTPALAGVTLDRIRDLEAGARCAWGAAAEGARAVVAQPAPAALSSSASSDPAYPLALVEAASACRSGDASHFWPWTRGLVQEDAVQIHPETARCLGIESGAEVAIDTPRGTLAARASVSRAVSRWAVATPRGPAGLPALVRKTEQSPDAARALLHGARR